MRSLALALLSKFGDNVATFIILRTLSNLQINHNNSRNYQKDRLFDLMSFTFGLNSNEQKGISVPFQVLAQSGGYQEQWLTSAEVLHQGDSECSVYQSEDFLVLSFAPKTFDIAAITNKVYRHALSQAESLGYLELVRTWNYFPRINDEEDVEGEKKVLERYQSFCVERQDVLSQFPMFQKQNPAATAIGTHAELNSFVFLFAKARGVGIENSRQLSAWDYPAKYAPKQPRFARAMRHSGILICSGTASVVGHETQHVGELEMQLNESLLNVETLLEQDGAKVALKDGFFRFYLRDPSETSFVVNCLKRSKIKQYVILAADVCRADLLIECEAVFQ